MELDTPGSSGEIDFDDQDRCPPKKSLGLFIFAQITKASGMTIILTTTDGYNKYLGLDSGFWNGFMVGILPIVGGLSAFGWQYVNNKYGYRNTNIIMFFLGFIGSILYALAGYSNSPEMLVIGRTVMGLATASNVLFHYLAVTVGKNKKSVLLTQVIIATNMGLAIGPVLGSGITYFFGEKLHLGDSAPILFNVYTIPGWFMALLYVMLILSFGLFFDNVPVSEQHRYRDYQLIKNVNDPESAVSTPPKVSCWVTISLFMFLVATIVVGVGIGGTETRTAFVATANATFASSTGTGFGFSMSPTVGGLYLGAVFTFFCIFCYYVSDLTKKATTFEDRHWILACLSMSAASTAMLYDYNLPVASSIAIWTIGLVAVDTSLTLAKGRVFGLSLKICPNKWIDIYTSLLGFLNSLGRGIGPVIATYIGNGYLDSNIFASILLACIVGTGLAIASMFTHLKPKTD